MKPKTIGGSTIGAIAGLNKYTTPFEAWEALVLGKEKEDSIPMAAGRFLEPLCSQLYLRETGHSGSPAHHVTNEKHPWAHGSLDGTAEVDGETRVVEFKTANEFARKEWQGNSVPPSYYCQVQFYMALTGYTKADFGVLFGNRDFEIYTVNADAEFQDMLLQLGALFWNNHVLTGTPPPETGKAALIKNMQVGTSPVLQCTPNDAASRLALRFAELKKVKKKLEVELEDVETEIIENFGKHRGLEGPGWQLKINKLAGKRSTSWKSVAEELHAPETLIQKHSKLGEENVSLTFKDLNATHEH